MKLSVLICTIPKRQMMFRQLKAILESQLVEGVEILSDDHPTLTTGGKRQRLLLKSVGSYVCFVDDDDMIDPDYIKTIVEAIDHSPDVICFKGWMLTNGRNRTEWIISNSLPYEDSLIGRKKVYLRFPNHLCPIKREIALRIGYPHLTYREDYDYALRLKESGLVKTETFIDKHLYTYNYVRK